MELTWSSTMIKYVLFVFNFFFVISGIIMICVGVSVKEFYQEYDIFLDSRYFSLPNLLIAIGALIFFISFFGCCGALKESWFMIFIFSILLAIIFILEFSAGIAGYVLRDSTSDYLTDSLTDSMELYKQQNDTDPTTIMWDIIQDTFKCCGAKSPEDWTVHDWRPFNETMKPDNGTLPNSCCKSKPGSVGISQCNFYNESSATYYKKGCVKGFGDYLKDHAVTLGAVGIVIGIIQLCAVIFSCRLTKQLRNGVYSG